MEQFHFNYKDIFRINRYGFSFRRISIHFVGILLGYLIYEILVYLSLFIVDGVEAREFWNSFGLLPVPPFFATQLNLFTTGAMWVGLFTFAAIYYLVSTAASTITIEQLRGDPFYSVGNALTLVKENWKSIFGSYIGLVIILFFIFMIPYSVMLLGKIPYIGKPILVFASFFTPIAFFLGLLITLLITVSLSSLFLVPAIIATTTADAFETIYQLFAIIWNQPWRLVAYGALLLLLKLIFVPILALFCIAGFVIILVPMYLLHTPYIQESMAYVNKWLGETLQKFVAFISQDNSIVFDMNTTHLSSMTFSTTICAIFITLTVICIAGGVVAYLFSLASVGTTLIYIILRRRIDGQNLLVSIGTDGNGETLPLPTGDE